MESSCDHVCLFFHFKILGLTSNSKKEKKHPEMFRQRSSSSRFSHNILSKSIEEVTKENTLSSDNVDADLEESYENPGLYMVCKSLHICTCNSTRAVIKRVTFVSYFLSSLVVYHFRCVVPTVLKPSCVTIDYDVDLTWNGRHLKNLKIRDKCRAVSLLQVDCL